MRYRFLLIITIVLFVFGFIFAGVPAANSPVADNLSVTARQTFPVPAIRAVQTPAVTPPARSGEVEFPITRGIRPRPTIHTTPPTPTVPPTTPQPTPTPTTRQPTPTPTISQPSPSPTTLQSTPTPATTQPTSSPTTLQQTPTQTLTVQGTTAPITQTTTPAPAVTVTVFVYRSGPVYRPVYYYPPGYPYNINSYYPSGTLTVTSNPSEATVILDSYNSETTPYIFTGLTTGYHTVEVDYPGYEAYITNVYVEDGGNPEINADLTPLINYGSLFIDSTPRGADVYVDGNYEGSSPVTVSALSTGPHQVELHLAGYDVLMSTQYVTAGQGTVANLALAAYTASSGYGSIDITSDHAGALVYLDGIYKGATISGNIFNIISVTPGTHTILLHIPGYTDFTQTVQVYNGQITNVNASFASPSAAVQQGPGTTTSSTGSIIATSSPAGGQVFLDNQFRGIAPVTIYNVAAGSHIVNMKLAGYSDWSSSVTVLADQMVQVPATFTQGTGVPTQTRADLPPVIVIGALGLGLVILKARFDKRE